MTDNWLAKTVERLRHQGTDDAEVEVKECSKELSRDIWETVSAFANTAGGYIILGLSESAGFSPVGMFDADRVRDQFVAGMGDGGSSGTKVLNPPAYSIERAFLDDSPLLIIHIEELGTALKPCYIEARGEKRGSYKRVDDKDIVLSDNELFSISTATRVSVFDREPVADSSISCLNSSILDRTIERAVNLTPRALRDASDRQTKLERLNFLDGSGKVTKAGLLAAGVYPQQFYPRLIVDVAVFPGHEKGASDPVRFLDRTICEGTIGEIIADAVTAITKNLRRRSVVIGMERSDELEIPVEVIREIVANALIHRDYSSRYDGQAISVDIFDDRIEVLNPGGLYGTKTRLNIADGASCCRNATLMRLMSLVPLPDSAGSPAEGNGSGIPMVIATCKKRGLPAPEFRPQLDSFKVILYRPSPELVSGAAAKRGKEYVLSLLRANSEMSVRELVSKTGLSENQVRYRLNALISDGAIEPTAGATSRLRRYRVL